MLKSRWGRINGSVSSTHWDIERLVRVSRSAFHQARRRVEMVSVLFNNHLYRLTRDRTLSFLSHSLSIAINKSPISDQIQTLVAIRHPRINQMSSFPKQNLEDPSLLAWTVWLHGDTRRFFPLVWCKPEQRGILNLLMNYYIIISPIRPKF